MKIDDRYSVSIWADEKMYVDDRDYRNYIIERIQNKLSKAIISDLCTKGAIVAIEGDSTTRKDEVTCGIICRQDVYVKELVRCKDCKKHTDGNKEFHEVFCEVYEVVKSENGYCDEAVRKDEVEEETLEAWNLDGSPTRYIKGERISESTMGQVKKEGGENV